MARNFNGTYKMPTAATRWAAETSEGSAVSSANSTYGGRPPFYSKPNSFSYHDHYEHAYANSSRQVSAPTPMGPYYSSVQTLAGSGSAGPRLQRPHHQYPGTSGIAVLGVSAQRPQTAFQTTFEANHFSSAGLTKDRDTGSNRFSSHSASLVPRQMSQNKSPQQHSACLYCGSQKVACSDLAGLPQVETGFCRCGLDSDPYSRRSINPSGDSPNQVQALPMYAGSSGRDDDRHYGSGGLNSTYNANNRIPDNYSANDIANYTLANGMASTINTITPTDVHQASSHLNSRVSYNSKGHPAQFSFQNGFQTDLDPYRNVRLQPQQYSPAYNHVGYGPPSPTGPPEYYQHPNERMVSNPSPTAVDRFIPRGSLARIATSSPIIPTTLFLKENDCDDAVDFDEKKLLEGSTACRSKKKEAATEAQLIAGLSHSNFNASSSGDNQPSLQRFSSSAGKPRSAINSAKSTGKGMVNKRQLKGGRNSLVSMSAEVELESRDSALGGDSNSRPLFKEETRVKPSSSSLGISKGRVTFETDNTNEQKDKLLSATSVNAHGTVPDSQVTALKNLSISSSQNQRVPNRDAIRSGSNGISLNQLRIRSAPRGINSHPSSGHNGSSSDQIITTIDTNGTGVGNVGSGSANTSCNSSSKPPAGKPTSASLAATQSLPTTTLGLLRTGRVSPHRLSALSKQNSLETTGSRRLDTALRRQTSAGHQSKETTGKEPQIQKSLANGDDRNVGEDDDYRKTGDMNEANFEESDYSSLSENDQDDKLSDDDAPSDDNTGVSTMQTSRAATPVSTIARSRTTRTQSEPSATIADQSTTVGLARKGSQEGVIGPRKVLSREGSAASGKGVKPKKRQQRRRAVSEARRASISSSSSVEAGEPALWNSLFSNVPPTINFVEPGNKVQKLAWSLRKMLRWRMSPITPNVVKLCIARSGFRSTDKMNQWLGTWGRHMKPAAYKYIREYQKINHFPGTFQIGRKDRLWRNLSRMASHHSKKEFNFFPITYVLPADLQSLKVVWDEGPAKQQWIIKPPASARGIGVRVISKWPDVPKKRPVIVQRYISRPLLVNGSKFDLRIYVYVTSYDPLRIYIHEKGLVRFASVKYSHSCKNLNNKFMHLTNYSINKENSGYIPNGEEHEANGHKWSLQTLWEYLRAQGINTTEIWDSIRDIVIKTIISSESIINTYLVANVRRRYCVHELFGFDIMLDEKYKSWLIEVNISPSLHSNSNLDISVKGLLVRDVLNIAGYMIPSNDDMHASSQSQSIDYSEEPSCRECMDRRLWTVLKSADEKAKHVYYCQRHADTTSQNTILNILTPDDLRVLIETVDEYNRRGQFQRVFPAPGISTQYLKYIEQPRYYNLLLDTFVHKYPPGSNQGISLLESYCSKKIHLQSPTAINRRQWQAPGSTVRESPAHGRPSPLMSSRSRLSEPSLSSTK